jgi:hypothetical protein
VGEEADVSRGVKNLQRIEEPQYIEAFSRIQDDVLRYGEEGGIF